MDGKRYFFFGGKKSHKHEWGWVKTGEGSNMLKMKTERKVLPRVHCDLCLVPKLLLVLSSTSEGRGRKKGRVCTFFFYFYCVLLLCLLVHVWFYIQHKTKISFDQMQWVLKVSDVHLNMKISWLWWNQQLPFFS